jgi:hypothetical protein
MGFCHPVAALSMPQGDVAPRVPSWISFNDHGR